MNVALSIIGVVISVSGLVAATSIGYRYDADRSDAEQPDDTNNYCKEGSFAGIESNCTAFLVCAAGEWTEMICPPGLHFNTELSVCDYPASAKCSDEIPPPTGVPNDCPSQGSGDLLQHPKCDRYYICDYGVPYEQRCGDGQHFNIVASLCDWPENANCVEGAAVAQPGAVLLIDEMLA